MLSNHPQTAVFLGSAIKNNAQPNKAEHYLSVCAQLKAAFTLQANWRSGAKRGEAMCSEASRQRPANTS